MSNLGPNYPGYPGQGKQLISHTVVGDYINIMKTTFDFNLIYIKLLNSMDSKKKHGKNKKLLIKKLLFKNLNKIVVFNILILSPTTVF